MRTRKFLSCGPRIGNSNVKSIQRNNFFELELEFEETKKHCSSSLKINLTTTNNLEKKYFLMIMQCKMRISFICLCLGDLGSQHKQKESK